MGPITYEQFLAVAKTGQNIFIRNKENNEIFQVARFNPDKFYINYEAGMYGYFFDRDSHYFELVNILK